MTKIVFLDIDGVLVTDDYFRSNKFVLKSKSTVPYKWTPECCMALNKIEKETNCLYVISSDWRLHYSLDDMKELFWMYSLNGDKIIGFTGNSRKGMSHDLESNRNSEIHSWKDRHRIESWVAIDDMPLNLSNFVMVEDTSKGLTLELAEKAIQILNRDI